MQFARLPRLRLAGLPTPLEEATRLERLFPGVRLFLKRDDLTHPALGGNKARKLEFLLADARRRGADVVLTVGGPQSNHARITAALSARLGWECILVLEGAEPPEAQGNLLIDRLLGADVRFAGARPAQEVMEEIAAGLEARGRRPYAIPVGGSTPLGAVGYCLAMEEMLAQASDAGVVVHRVYVATGSGGTQAGLVLGAGVLDPSLRVTGVSVSRSAEESRSRVAELATGAASLLGLPVRVEAAGVEVLDGYVGPGYGVPTPACVEAIRLAAREEGVLLDPVYTGKAMACLLDHLRRGVIREGENVVFWHTGGAPALFAYWQELEV
ncbi:MAG: D-cysteine desulfhydrase family protein [Bacillota bacterium]|nr:D-cysteine desulfhydrase family protein [Bacillota bacterium]MDI7248930.1 D-cysteine desulfhydrase family protein [Bacillota bacterium]